MNKPNFKHTFNSIKRSASKRSPEILIGLGIAGMLTTTVLAVKATPKAIKLKELEENEKQDYLTKTELVKATWKCYIPTVLIGMSTISCIVGANMLSQKSQASLISAYTLLDNSFKEYRKKANDIFGEDADKRIKEAIAKEKFSKQPFKVTEDKQLFYDMTSDRYFESTLAEVYRAEYELNREYAKHGYCCLNDFYDLIGIDEVAYGYETGWSMDASNMFYGYNCIDFEHELVSLEDEDDGLECYVLIMPFPPTADYLC